MHRQEDFLGIAKLAGQLGKLVADTRRVDGVAAVSFELKNDPSNREVKSVLNGVDELPRFALAEGVNVRGHLP